jgi:hypothetical protein
MRFGRSITRSRCTSVWPPPRNTRRMNVLVPEFWRSFPEIMAGSDPVPKPTRAETGPHAAELDTFVGDLLAGPVLNADIDPNG